jgi:hypothetical protein
VGTKSQALLLQIPASVSPTCLTDFCAALQNPTAQSAALSKTESERTSKNKNEEACEHDPTHPVDPLDPLREAFPLAQIH